MRRDAELHAVLAWGNALPGVVRAGRRHVDPAECARRAAQRLAGAMRAAFEAARRCRCARSSTTGRRSPPCSTTPATPSCCRGDPPGRVADGPGRSTSSCLRQPPCPVVALPTPPAHPGHRDRTAAGRGALREYDRVRPEQGAGGYRRRLREDCDDRHPAAPRPQRARLRTTTCDCSTPGGGRPTTCRSARSTCWTTRCCASRCGSSTSSRGCSATGAPRPGLTFLWAHLNRVIVAPRPRMLYVTGPGHGGPGVVAAAYLEGTYSELYSAVTQDEEGLRRLFRQFSFPGGIPSHAAPGDARLDQRGRRAGLLADARVRRRVRQPRPGGRLRDRRRRGRDRAAGHLLALEQVPRPGRRTARCCRSCT